MRRWMRLSWPGEMILYVNYEISAVEVVGRSRTELLENDLLCLLGYLCILKFDFDEAWDALHHPYDCCVGEVSAVFEVDAL